MHKLFVFGQILFGKLEQGAELQHILFVHIHCAEANLICISVNFSGYTRKMNSQLPSFQYLRARQGILEEPVFNKLTTIEETLTVHSLCLPNCQAREVALITATYFSASIANI